MAPFAYLLLFFAFMSFVAFVLTVYDKSAAKSKKRRIPEKTLLFVGFFGGAAVMYVTMKLIRHKTRHKKFMILLPIFSVLHIVIISFMFCIFY